MVVRTPILGIAAVATLPRNDNVLSTLRCQCRLKPSRLNNDITEVGGVLCKNSTAFFVFA